MEEKKSKGAVQARQPKTDSEGATLVLPTGVGHRCEVHALSTFSDNVAKCSCVHLNSITGMQSDTFLFLHALWQSAQ